MAFNITPAAVLSDAATVVSILQKTLNVDVVAVLNQETMLQVIHDARPVRAEVLETSTVMKYPVETGAIISDHRVSNPTEIKFVCVIPSTAYSSAYQELRNAWLNATLLSVQTRTGTYRNMIVANMPHEETPDMFNAITQFIHFEEVIFVAPASIATPNTLANFSPANPANNSTVNSGLLAPITVAGSALSYLHAATVFGVPI